MMHPRSRWAVGNRSSVVFLTGLVLAAAVAIWLDGVGAYKLQSGNSRIALNDDSVLAPLGPRELTDADLAAARTAWNYFAANTQPATGFVDSVSGFPSTTMWDQGSYVLALASAQALGIIDKQEFDSRADRFLTSLARLPLFDGALPNKAYNTVTLEMVNYDNTPAPDGIGWSALDVARLLTGLRVLERRAPEFGPRIRSLLAGWRLSEMVHLGALTGADRNGDQTDYKQEGRIGYEQYGARAAALWGLDVIQSISAAPIVRWVTVSGIEVPADRRLASAFDAITPVLSEPYMLLGLELGLDSENTVLADRVFRAQMARANAEGVPTMVSEDHIDRSPSFLYSSVYANGRPWNVVTESGESFPEFRTVSLKAVYAWDALYGHPYTAELRSNLADLATEGGWYAGRFETSGEANDVLTLNTNAVVLEAIHYKAFGPLWQLQ